MFAFYRRKFLEVLGKGTAALGLGFSFLGAGCESKEPYQHEGGQKMTNKTMTDDEIRARNRKIIDQWLAGPEKGVDPWYVPGSPARAVLSDDFVFEIPFSPRGMLKVYRGEEREAFWEFLGKSVKDYSYTKQYFYETSDPYTFITEDEGEGPVTWGSGGRYRNRHITVLRCNKEGKLCLYREYFNPQYHWPETTVDAGDGDTFDYNKERKRVGLEPVPLTREETHRMPRLE
jgi:ketosteroid isomerase-like protein